MPAPTRGTVTGGNMNADTSQASRLGARYVTATANTFSTFATVTTWADGRVTFDVRGDAGELVRVEVNAEGDSGQPRRVGVHIVPGRAVDAKYTTEPDA